MIADEIKVCSLTVAPSPGETDALYKRVFPSCSGGIVSVLTEQIPPHPYLLPIVLADYFQVVSESAASYAISCDSRDSTDHSNALCEHRPVAHAEENAG